MCMLKCMLTFAQSSLVKERFVLVQKNDVTSLYPVTDNADFSVSADEKFIISDAGSDDTVIDLKEVTGFGITTRISASDHDIIDDITDADNKQWSISSIRGVLLRSSRSGTPDLSDLEKGQIYILKIGSATYKYVSL